MSLPSSCGVMLMQPQMHAELDAWQPEQDVL